VVGGVALATTAPIWVAAGVIISLVSATVSVAQYSLGYITEGELAFSVAINIVGIGLSAGGYRLAQGGASALGNFVSAKGFVYSRIGVGLALKELVSD